MNVCVQCGQPQIVDGVAHPMVHAATKGLSSTADDVQSWHLDCMPHDLEQAHRPDHGDLIDQIKGDTGRDYAARRQWAVDHGEQMAAAAKDGA